MVLLMQVDSLVGQAPDGVLVNGDSGNDIELFQVPGVRGTMVANAHPELREWIDQNPSPNIFKVRSLCTKPKHCRNGPSLFRPTFCADSMQIPTTRKELRVIQVIQPIYHFWVQMLYLEHSSPTKYVSVQRLSNFVFDDLDVTFAFHG